MPRVKRVGMLSVATTAALIHALSALIFAVPLVLWFLLETELGTAIRLNNPWVVWRSLTAVELAICIPLFTAIMGFLGGVIGALLYNLVALVTGGVQVDLDPGETKPLP